MIGKAAKARLQRIERYRKKDIDIEALQKNILTEHLKLRKGWDREQKEKELSSIALHLLLIVQITIYLLLIFFESPKGLNHL